MGKKIIVIGGGPGGYTAAIRSAQLGGEVILAETANLGGTCLNVGCIPTKALLHTTGFYRRAKDNAMPGVIISSAELDWPAAQSHKNDVVGRLSSGIGVLLRYNGVTVRGGIAVPLSGKSVRIGEETLEADAVILATGSVNTPLAFPGAGLPGVIDSTEALALERVPESIVIAGGGVIGVEFATLFSSAGAKTTLIELTPRLLPSADAEIAEYIKASLESSGVAVHTGARLASAEAAPEGLTVNFDEDGESWIVTAEKLLIAVGRQPNTVGLGLENINVTTARGAIETDKNFLTTVPGIYAVGDCNGRSMLAHAAMAQGMAAAEHIMGYTTVVNQKIIPACVYSSPEIASCGLTEEQAAAMGINYSVGRFDLGGNAKSVIEGVGGFVKIIAGNELREILGVHIAGENATELIAEAALCISMEGTVDDIVGTIHSHPTVSESIREAAMSVFGMPIHGI